MEESSVQKLIIIQSVKKFSVF